LSVSTWIASRWYDRTWATEEITLSEGDSTIGLKIDGQGGEAGTLI